MKGESLIVYPDIDYTGNYNKPSDIYDGFLYLGELYYKKTGTLLQFVPLLIDDKTRQICAGVPVHLCDYRKEKADAADTLKRAINVQCSLN